MARLDEDAQYLRKGPSGWIATQALLTAWRSAGGVRGLPATLTLADDARRPTGPLLGLWRAAFPGILPPRASETLCETNGKGSAELFRAFRRIP